MRGDQRGRVTVPDVVFVLMSVAVLGALYPVFRASLDQNAGSMGTGTVYLFILFLPLAVLVLFMLLFTKSTAGGP